jgi:DNA repair protein RecO (recombination protein O)
VPGPTSFTDAILLRSVDYAEADRIVTLLTADLGKVSLLARGARRSQRRFGAALQAYTVLRAEVGQGRGELGRLAQAQVVRAYRGIMGNLRKMMAAGAGLTLVREALPPREPDARMFRTCVAFLDGLEQAGEAAEVSEAVLLAFQVRLMALAGFAPELDACAGCGKHAADGQAALFDPDRGAVVCRACGGGSVLLSGSTRAHLRVCAGSAWAEPRPWTAQERTEAGTALERLVARHLGKVLKARSVS